MSKVVRFGTRTRRPMWEPSRRRLPSALGFTRRPLVREPRERRGWWLGDGAPWIWGIAAEHFHQAIQIVDLYHARQRLFELGKAVLGGDSPEIQPWVRLNQELLDRETEAVLNSIRQLAVQTECPRINISKDDSCAASDGTAGRADEGQGCRDDFVTRPHLEGHHAQIQGCSAAVYGNRLAGALVGPQGLLEARLFGEREETTTRLYRGLHDFSNRPEVVLFVHGTHGAEGYFSNRQGLHSEPSGLEASRWASAISARLDGIKFTPYWSANSAKSRSICFMVWCRKSLGSE